MAQVPKRAFRNTVVLSSVALAVTGVAIGAGMLENADVASPELDASADLDATLAGGTPATTADSDGESVLADRDPVISRNDTRGRTDQEKAAGLVEDAPQAITETRSLSDSDPRDIARILMGDFGFGADQFGCLDSLWTRESNWNPLAHNPSSGAHGIPQSLPGSKMATVAADWYDNPVTQITWGLGYIQDRYGSPCSAWGHSQAVGWY